MKTVKIIRVRGYRPGEIANLPDSMAITYCRNGQAEPVGWSLSQFDGPQNRMLDTGSRGASGHRAMHTRGARKKRASRSGADEEQ